MNRETLSAAVGSIDDLYIEEAAEGCSRQRKKPIFFSPKRMIPTAACLLLLAGALLWMRQPASPTLIPENQTGVRPTEAIPPSDEAKPPLVSARPPVTAGPHDPCREDTDNLPSEEDNGKLAPQTVTGTVTAVLCGAPASDASVSQDCTVILKLQLEDGQELSVEVPQEYSTAYPDGAKVSLSYLPDKTQPDYIKAGQMVSLVRLEE